MGVVRDELGITFHQGLTALTPGAEAQPCVDRAVGVVYKFFDLRPNGSLGKKLIFGGKEENSLTGERFEVESIEASWTDVIAKITVLNSGGGLPTEIVGLADTGDFLIAKQPLAHPVEEFFNEREVAEERMRGVVPTGGGLRERIFVTYVDGEFWMIGDLHQRNIMRDSRERPTIIDALLGEITPTARSNLGWVEKACQDAKYFREHGVRPKSSFDAVDDDQL